VLPLITRNIIAITARKLTLTEKPPITNQRRNHFHRVITKWIGIANDRILGRGCLGERRAWAGACVAAFQDTYVASVCSQSI
jgi:hypothetical protein